VYGVYFKNDAAAATGSKDEADFGIGANLGYDVNENFGADLRIEYVAMNDKGSYYNPNTNNWTALTGANEVESFMGATLGGHYKFNDNVKAKFDYTYAKFETKGTNADMDPAHIVNAGVVANF
jgi:opacity protein-like surface antigen